jgi:hypothetical protein
LFFGIADCLIFGVVFLFSGFHFVCFRVIECFFSLLFSVLSVLFIVPVRFRQQEWLSVPKDRYRQLFKILSFALLFRPGMLRLPVYIQVWAALEPE